MMTVSITIDLPENTYEALNEYKYQNGLTWRGVLLVGIDDSLIAGSEE